MAESTPNRAKQVSLEQEVAEAQKLNPGRKLKPNAVSEVGDLIKSHFYHLKKFYGMEK